MSELAIEAVGISKLYQLGRPRAASIREAMTDLVFRSSDPKRDLWALRNISFSVQAGQTYGVIGGNGAGKSTLLKILTGITRPTAGRALVNGRVGTLLEVGSSFHPELSGRENTFLNGAILGMKRTETQRRLDEIVAFADLEGFLDTPVKHYSSGMHVRLAFSIAAHLDLEILIVDEVLAVGDASFQQRSVDKIRELASSGRTILFTSHDMRTVEALCDKVLWLRHGEVVSDGNAAEVIAQYLGAVADQEL